MSVKLFTGKAFTLVELIIVILIIGVVAVIAIPQFVNLSHQAWEKSEENIIGAVQTGIRLYYLKNRDYPNADPFATFLEQPPSYKNQGTNYTPPAPDGKNWVVWTMESAYYDGVTIWAMACPHYDRANDKGTYWYYLLGDAPSKGKKKGDVVQNPNWPGHPW